MKIPLCGIGSGSAGSRSFSGRGGLEGGNFGPSAFGARNGREKFTGRCCLHWRHVCERDEILVGFLFSCRKCQR